MNILLKIKYPHNKFGKNIKISPNVKIGYNNIFEDNVVINHNTIIGNNNVFLRGNVIGETPIMAHCNHFDNPRNGLLIGDNNFFGINNIIFSGYNYKTIIKNNNKILGESHLGHDVKVYNNVTIYPRSIIGGYSILLDHCGLGMYSAVHQKIIVGQYSFIGMNNSITKHCFPFFININNVLHKPNTKKLNECNIDVTYDTLETLKRISESIKNKDSVAHLISSLPYNVQLIVNSFFDEIGTLN